MTYTVPGGPGLVCTELPASDTDRIELAAVPSAVRDARHWAADRLARSDPRPCQDLIDTAVLLVSELVTNAIRAADPAPGRAPGRAQPDDQITISLLITHERDRVRIAVHDSARGQVSPSCDRSADAETGRGLMVIAALSQSWGWRPTLCGKVVWCELSV